MQIKTDAVLAFAGVARRNRQRATLILRRYEKATKEMHGAARDARTEKLWRDLADLGPRRLKGKSGK